PHARLDWGRDRRGRVTLTGTWRICFLSREPVTIDVRAYEGIVTGKDHDAGIFEWFVLLCLMPGIIPAAIWWWVAIHSDTFFVALSRDHDYPAEILYRGWNEAHMKELARTLADVARLPNKSI